MKKVAEEETYLAICTKDVLQFAISRHPHWIGLFFYDFCCLPLHLLFPRTPTRHPLDPHYLYLSKENKALFESMTLASSRPVQSISSRSHREWQEDE